MVEVEVIDMPEKPIDRNRLLDIMLMLLILCAFLSGFWLGKYKQFNTSTEFYEEYISKSCACEYPLERQGDRIGYNYDVIPSLSNYGLSNTSGTWPK